MSNFENIKQNLDFIRIEGREIYIIGTAHISQSSADLVEQTIKEIMPDHVAVELCESRYQSMKDPERWRNTDIFTVLRQGKAYLLMAQLILMGFQRKLGSKLNIKPGAEMMRAIEVAEQNGAQIVLADRDIKTTLKRTWASLGIWSLSKLIVGMFFSVFSQQEISEEEIEKLKSTDVLESTMKELSDALPGVRVALIDERDKYLAQKIYACPGTKIVAVVGAGHVPGIKRYFGQVIDLQQLEKLPPPRAIAKILGWMLPLIIIALLAIGYLYSPAGASIGMLKAWVSATMFFTAIGAACAMAHPLSILAGAFAAPITPFHPILASGMFSALVEAFLRKPRVSDLETIADDLTSVSGFWTNRLSRILLILAFTNLGSSVGIAVGLPMMASWL